MSGKDLSIPTYIGLISRVILTLQRRYPVPDEDLSRVGMASEVLDALHGDAFVSEFDMNMLNTLIYHLCGN